MPDPTPDFSPEAIAEAPVLDERGVEAAAKSVKHEANLRTMARDKFTKAELDAWDIAFARAAITAYQQATEAALTEALRERDEVATLLAEGALAVADQRERAECLRDDYDASQMRLHRAEAALEASERERERLAKIEAAAREIDREGYVDSMQNVPSWQRLAAALTPSTPPDLREDA